MSGCDSASHEVDSEAEVYQEDLHKDFSVNWIEGEWRDTTLFNGKVTFAENWIKNNGESFSGQKFQISNGTQSSPTELGLVKTDGVYYYSIIEEERLTTFVQDSLGEQFISFVNTTEEFPSNLSYELQGRVLLISFSGMANGVFRKAAFNAVKIDID